jgi:hypothetical protein
VLGAPKTGDFYPAPGGKLRNAVIHLAEADAHFFCHIPLAKAGFLAQDLQQPIKDFLFRNMVHGMNFIDRGWVMSRKKSQDMGFIFSQPQWVGRTGCFLALIEQDKLASHHARGGSIWVHKAKKPASLLNLQQC